MHRKETLSFSPEWNRHTEQPRKYHLVDKFDDFLMKETFEEQPPRLVPGSLQNSVEDKRTVIIQHCGVGGSGWARCGQDADILQDVGDEVVDGRVDTPSGTEQLSFRNAVHTAIESVHSETIGSLLLPFPHKFVDSLFIPT
jgi:hypothetical protein